MTDEPEFAVGDPSTGAEEQTQEPTDEDSEILDIEEPLESARLSPYAIAAFVLSITGVWAAAQSVLFSAPYFYPPLIGTGWREIVFGLIPPALVPIGVATVALWVAGRAELEILDAGGRFGGVGLYRSARVVAFLLIVIMALGAAFRVLAPDGEFGFEEVEEVPAEEFEVEGEPP